MPRYKKVSLVAALLAGAVAGVAAVTLRKRGQAGRAEEEGEARPLLSTSDSSHRKFAEVEGIRMSWLEHGEGQPVILLHGIPTSPELWRYVIPQLSGVRVLAWEMVGYGMSIEAGKGRDLSVTAQAKYLAAWMRHLGIENAVLAAHDLGGGVAQIVAVRHPELCSGLLFTNAISYDSWPIPSVVAMRRSAPLTRKLPNSLFKLLLMSLFYRGHDNPAEARSAYQVHVDHYLSADGAKALVRQVEFLDVNDTLAVADALSSLRIPARVVWGAADQFQKLRYGLRLAQDLGAPLRKIPGGKHFTPEDHPGIISAEILALVREVEEARASGGPASAGLNLTRPGAVTGAATTMREDRWRSIPP